MACEATLDLAQALDMVADYQAYRGCCDATPLYRESIESLRQSLELVGLQGKIRKRIEHRIACIFGRQSAYFRGFAFLPLPSRF